MILELTPEQRAFKEQIEQFATEIVAPRAALIDKTGEYPSDVVHAAAGAGLCGVTLPKAWGGLGRDYVSYALAVEAIAKASATVAVALTVTNSLVAEVIAHAGKDQQRERWLRALGIGEAALTEAMTYARKREQFGQPIANYQAIQWMIADMATELDAARLLTLKAAAAKDHQEKSTFEASMAKLAASEAAHKAADKAMQILASAGYRRGSVVERLFRDVRATEIYQGTSEAQRMIIAANVLASA